MLTVTAWLAPSPSARSEEAEEERERHIASLEEEPRPPTAEVVSAHDGEIVDVAGPRSRHDLLRTTTNAGPCASFGRRRQRDVLDARQVVARHSRAGRRSLLSPALGTERRPQVETVQPPVVQGAGRVQVAVAESDGA